MSLDRIETGKATSRRGQQIWNKLTLMSISVRQSLQSQIITADSRDCVRLPAFTHNFKVPTLHIMARQC